MQFGIYILDLVIGESEQVTMNSWYTWAPSLFMVTCARMDVQFPDIIIPHENQDAFFSSTQRTIMKSSSKKKTDKIHKWLLRMLMSKKKLMGYTLWKVLEASQLPRILNRSETKKNLCHQNNFASSVLLLYCYIFISWPSRRLSSFTFSRVCYNKVLLLFIILILC
jgi:hypothetical protein